MVAVLRAGPTIRPMEDRDLVGVVAVEQASYPYPWSRHVFEDCIRVGYSCLVVEDDGGVCGHGIMMVRAGEAHLLNICVDPSVRRRGFASLLLHDLLDLARRMGAAAAFLEVRESNEGAAVLYEQAGFNIVGRRAGYYPAPFGREDAVVMARDLQPPELSGTL